MEEIISKGYARKSTREAAPREIWYLPHHGVYHPNKPGKIRVVLETSVQIIMADASIENFYLDQTSQTK